MDQDPGRRTHYSTEGPRTMSTIHGQPERIAGAVRTSAETAPHSQDPRQKHQQTENAAEDPRNRHTNGRTETAPRIPTTDRAEMLTGCRSHSRSHSPRSRHKTRRALYCYICEQIPTAGANRANLPHWTEAHRTTAEHTRSHTEPFSTILRTFTNEQISRA